MGFRDRLIGRSILRAIFKSASPRGLLARILAFFSFFQITLARFQAALFARLRREVWQMDEEEYTESFRSEREGGGLNATGDLGYSGSTFFTTANAKFLIKSLPRRFEYTFFSNDMLEPYAQHVTTHPSSLLVRITDFLYAPQLSLGSIIGTAPSHHVVMENVLYGKSQDELQDKWETYDLKPADYFYPERDIAGGALTSQETKDRLADIFDDKIRLTRQERDELVDLLGKDTALLESCNAVDYSLFLVRYPSPSHTTTPYYSDIPNHQDLRSSLLSRDVPSLTSRTSRWRTGITSADGKWVYRAVILDFFWAKHKLQAKAMTALVKTFNKVARHGPMSITTSPDEYRRRFMSMVQSLLEVEDES